MSYDITCEVVADVWRSFKPQHSRHDHLRTYIFMDKRTGKYCSTDIWVVRDLFVLTQGVPDNEFIEHCIGRINVYQARSLRTRFFL